MQRRERMLSSAVAALVALWLLDAAIVSPLLNWFDESHQEIERMEKEIAEARNLVDRKQVIMERWRAQHAAGLIQDEQSARFKVQEFIVSAAKKHRVVIDSVGGNTRPAYSSGDTYEMLSITLSAQGTLSSIKEFLSEVEHAPLPLRLERCELSTHDAKKDYLELSASMSTLIVSEAALVGRSVPEGTPVWCAEPMVPSINAFIVAAKPFLVDRRKLEKPVVETVREQPVVVTVEDLGTWAVVGIIYHADSGQVFLRHTKNNEEKVCQVGDSIDQYIIASLDNYHMTLHVQDAKTAPDEAPEVSVNENGEAIDPQPVQESEPASFGSEQIIEIGQTINGQSYTAKIQSKTTVNKTSVTTPVLSKPITPSSTISTPTTPSASDAERQAILDRLRNRRGRKDGE